MPTEPAELVRLLRAKADSTTFPAEAELLRKKADQLVRKHKLKAADLRPPTDKVWHHPHYPPTEEQWRRWARPPARDWRSMYDPPKPAADTSVTENGEIRFN